MSDKRSPVNLASAVTVSYGRDVVRPAGTAKTFLLKSWDYTALRVISNELLNLEGTLQSLARRIEREGRLMGWNGERHAGAVRHARARLHLAAARLYRLLADVEA